jgi:hypothetical protein
MLGIASDDDNDGQRSLETVKHTITKKEEVEEKMRFEKKF